MSRLFHPILYLLACATRQELARQVQYLKVENEVLRSRLPKAVRVTSAERRKLVRAGKGLGKAMKDLVTIVTPATFLKWVNQEARPLQAAHKRRKPGRPRTPDDIRALVVRLARENAWGYTRILGELRKLGIRRISRQTVKNILKEHGLEPGPKGGVGSWSEFLAIHAQTLWACDFFSKRIWTAGGLVDFYMLVFLHVGSRRAWVSASTAHPDARWVVQQARNFVMEEGEQAALVIRDNDTKFVVRFDEVLKSEGVAVKKITPVSPNLNAYAERLIQSVQQECLDHFVVLGRRHLDHIVREYVTHYNTERPHQARGNLPLEMREPPLLTEPIDPGGVVCRKRLGGLLRHYERPAA